LQHLRDSLCRTVALLDKDQSADQAKAKAIAAGLLAAPDVFQLHRPGGKETELEDLLLEPQYAKYVLDTHGVDLTDTTPQEAKLKWSDRMQAIAGRQGHPLSEDDVTSIKIEISNIIESAKGLVLKPGLRGPVDSLAAELEKRL
jgi:hypothetical protein